MATGENIENGKPLSLASQAILEFVRELQTGNKEEFKRLLREYLEEKGACPSDYADLQRLMGEIEKM